jgi:hypothetical protein
VPSYACTQPAAATMTMSPRILPISPRAWAGLLALFLAWGVSGAQAAGIWKWRDRDGRIQVSDRAPPVDVPDKDVLQRPSGARAPVVVVASPDAAASAVQAPAAPSVDPELEAKRKKALAEKAEQEQAKLAADTEKRNAIKAENCKRARAQLAVLESGQRVARPNDKGEREILDDNARGAEMARTRDLVNTNCN